MAANTMIILILQKFAHSIWHVFFIQNTSACTIDSFLILQPVIINWLLPKSSSLLWPVSFHRSTFLWRFKISHPTCLILNISIIDFVTIKPVIPALHYLETVLWVRLRRLQNNSPGLRYNCLRLPYNANHERKPSIMDQCINEGPSLP